MGVSLATIDAWALLSSLAGWEVEQREESSRANEMLINS